MLHLLKLLSSSSSINDMDWICFQLSETVLALSILFSVVDLRRVFHIIVHCTFKNSASISIIQVDNIYEHWLECGLQDV